MGLVRYYTFKRAIVRETLLVPPYRPAHRKHSKITTALGISREKIYCVPGKDTQEINLLVCPTTGIELAIIKDFLNTKCSDVSYHFPSVDRMNRFVTLNTSTHSNRKKEAKRYDFLYY